MADESKRRKDERSASCSYLRGFSIHTRARAFVCFLDQYYVDVANAFGVFDLHLNAS